MDLIKSINSNILTKKMYKYEYDIIDTSFSLDAKIALYKSYEHSRIIPFDILLKHPIIYDKIEQNYITIVFCPITMAVTGFFGKYVAKKYVGDVLYLEDKKNGNIFPIYEIHNSDIKSSENVKRITVMLMTYRDTIKYQITFYPMFVTLNNSIKHNEYIIDKEYYENDLDMNDKHIETKIHPKTLVYLIIYKSNKSNKIKQSIIIGKGASDKISGFNQSKSLLFKFIYEIYDTILNRKGYIVPMLWYMAEKIFPDAKNVFVN